VFRKIFGGFCRIPFELQPRLPFLFCRPTCCSAAGRDESQSGTALMARPQQQKVGLRQGCGTPRSLQIFLARWSFISLWRGMALRLF